jgi:signal peptidase I
MIPGVIAGSLALLVAAMSGTGLLKRRLTVVRVFGPSMQPALSSGDRVLVRRASISDLRRGHIVVVEKPGDEDTWAAHPPRWPADSREWLIKRVAALPGDPWPDAITQTADLVGRVVPAGNLVVLGDNAARSLDSRALGCIPADRLLGVMLRPLPTRSG